MSYIEYVNQQSGPQADTLNSQWPPLNPGSAQHPELYQPTPEAVAHYKQLIAIYNPLGKLAAHNILAALDDPEQVAATASEQVTPLPYADLGSPYQSPLLAPPPPSEAVRQQFTGRENELDVLYNFMQRNRRNVIHQAGLAHRYDAYLYGFTPTIERRPLLDTVITPVGSYGEQHARRINAVGRFGLKIISNTLRAASDKAWEENEEILRRTSRGLDGLRPIAALLEGWASLTQTTAHLSGQEVSGYQNGHDLTKDLLDNGLAKRVTQLIPMGVMGPATMAGVFYPRPVREADGSLVLTPAFEKRLIEAHVEHMKYAAQGISTGDYGKWGTGLICPVAGKGGALDPLGQAFSAAMQKF